MELTNDFRVAVPVEQAWAVLTDLERIAPCLPGAQLQEVEGDEFRGVVKVKVGPITAQYKGVATIEERDDATHRLVIRAEGRDTRGQGSAAATITALLTPEGDGTAVSVVTDLTITGKVAQFGRGAIVEVSSKLMDQFVRALEADVLTGVIAPAPTTDAPEVTATVAQPRSGSEASDASVDDRQPSPGVRKEAQAAPERRRIDSSPAEPVDLVSAAGSSAVKRVGPVLAVVLLALLLWRRHTRRR
jgi:hypothetical protein